MANVNMQWDLIEKYREIMIAGEKNFFSYLTFLEEQGWEREEVLPFTAKEDLPSEADGWRIVYEFPKPGWEGHFSTWMRPKPK